MEPEPTSQSLDFWSNFWGRFTIQLLLRHFYNIRYEKTDAFANITTPKQVLNLSDIIADIINIDQNNQHHQPDKQLIHSFIMDFFIDGPPCHTAQNTAADHAAQ